MMGAKGQIPKGIATPRQKACDSFLDHSVFFFKHRIVGPLPAANHLVRSPSLEFDFRQLGEIFDYMQGVEWRVGWPYAGKTPNGVKQKVHELQYWMTQRLLQIGEASFAPTLFWDEVLAQTLRNWKRYGSARGATGWLLTQVAVDCFIQMQDETALEALRSVERPGTRKRVNEALKAVRRAGEARQPSPETARPSEARPKDGRAGWLQDAWMRARGAYEQFAHGAGRWSVGHKGI